MLNKCPATFTRAFLLKQCWINVPLLTIATPYAHSSVARGCLVLHLIGLYALQSEGRMPV
ncbi:hypothetical protein BGZ63DRAFT_370795 [Mariannaea sp. PMI_226]|nr:hypothetical protein BGZ63DRAFT_370795 [Mariannaea sp. PMI_226]